MAKQNQQDLDTEIMASTTRYEKKLKVEREEGQRLKGENGIMRKKFNTLNKDIEDNRAEIQRMKENAKKLDGVITVLEKDILHLRKEVLHNINARCRTETSISKTRNEKFMTSKNVTKNWKSTSLFSTTVSKN